MNGLEWKAGPCGYGMVVADESGERIALISGLRPDRHKEAAMMAAAPAMLAALRACVTELERLGGNAAVIAEAAAAAESAGADRCIESREMPDCLVHWRGLDLPVQVESDEDGGEWGVCAVRLNGQWVTQMDDAWIFGPADEREMNSQLVREED